MSHMIQVPLKGSYEETVAAIRAAATRLGYPVSIRPATKPWVYRLLPVSARLRIWREAGRSRDLVHYMIGQPLPLP